MSLSPSKQTVVNPLGMESYKPKAKENSVNIQIDSLKSTGNQSPNLNNNDNSQFDEENNKENDKIFSNSNQFSQV